MQSMVLTLRNSQIWLETPPGSSSLTIYFSNLPFCGLQLPHREKHSFSLRSLTCDLDSLSLLSNRTDSLVTSVTSKGRNCVNAQNNQSIRAMKSHSCALATFQI